jgi:two-component system LytT family response regulator
MSRPIRALIVDDEKPARSRLVELLRRQPAVLVTAACAGGREALDVVSAAGRSGTPIDVIFLDVQMPEMDGFAMLEALYALPHEQVPVVVFTTAYDEYALRAFDARAIDYLLKPFSDERFEIALTRAIRLARGGASEALVANMRALLGDVADASWEHRPETTLPSYLDRIAVKERGRVHLIDVSDIRWISADGVYVTIHTPGRAYLHREVLGRLEAQLDPRRFVRVHRSHLVNFDCVRELVQDVHGDFSVRLDDATTLRVSRIYRPRLEARLNQRL